jgi:sugar lactone lactonase YvrE
MTQKLPPTPYTLHPTPYALHPTPYALHPTPYTLIPLLLAFLLSCSPQFYTSHIDMTMSGGILWPGKPEEPRIRYLWSLQQVNYQEGKTIVDILAGLEDLSDPKNSPILLRPQGIYVDDKRFYIADPGAGRVTIIDKKDMKTFHIIETDREELQYPISVVSDREGNIYVSDPDLGRVIKYMGDGRFISYLEGEWIRPSGLAIDRKRDVLYVADTLGHKVYAYSTSGKRLYEIGRRGEGEGEFNYPGYLFVDRDGLLYVSDSLNFRVQIFGPDGRFMAKFGEPGDAYHTFDKPKGVATDSEGNIYVVDAGKDMVKIFDRQGNLLLFFGEKGHEYGKFYLPTGIFIYDDVIYVADTINMRIQAFEYLKEKR